MRAPGTKTPISGHNQNVKRSPCELGDFTNFGVVFCGAYVGDSIDLGPYLGAPEFWKLPTWRHEAHDLVPSCPWLHGAPAGSTVPFSQLVKKLYLGRLLKM